MATVYKVHPAIGIARVGNSPDEFFIGPERIGQPPDPPGGFKDAQCRVKCNQLRGQAGVRARSGVQACPARASRMACMGGTALSLMVIR